MTGAEKVNESRESIGEKDSHGLNIVAARYHACGLAELDSNPFCAALPPLPKNDQELKRLLHRAPMFDETERELSPYLRQLAVSRLSDLYIPQARHMEAAKSILLLIYAGYRKRNPTTALGRQILHGQIVADNSMAVLVSLSGSGKSSLIARLVEILGPPLINHEEFNGIKIYRKQLVTLGVVCHKRDTPANLAQKVATRMDQLCGTNYAQIVMSKATSQPRALAVMGQGMRNLSIGLLHVDEAHHFKTSTKKQSQDLMDAMVSTRQETAAPILLSATPRIEAVFGKEFAAARRVCDGGGLLHIDRYNGPDDLDFIEFLNEMWRYQWVAEPKTIGKAEIDAFWKCTQGVLGLLVALFATAQRNAIAYAYKPERVDAALIEATFTDQFGPIHGAIRALRSGRDEDLMEFEDLWEAHKQFIDDCLGDSPTA